MVTQERGPTCPQKQQTVQTEPGILDELVMKTEEEGREGTVATWFSFPDKGQRVEPGIGVRTLGGALQVPIPWGLLGSSMISSPSWHSCTWSSFCPESSQPSCALQGPAPVHLSGRLYLHRHSPPNMELGTPLQQALPKFKDLLELHQAYSGCLINVTDSGQAASIFSLFYIRRKGC